MLIVCPRCDTTFTLPDELYKPGKKARCSNCGLVFPMQSLGEPSAETAPAPPSKPEPAKPASKASFWQKYRMPLAGFVAVFLLVLLGYGAWLIVGSFTGGSDAPVAEKKEDTSSQIPPGGDQLISSISLDEVRQFQVDNSQIGKIIVIQGFAINISDTPKEFVAVEARLLDINGKTLSGPIQQLCGVPLTLFQLQSLSAVDLDKALKNNLTIMTYNTGIPSGGKVPFVLVFPTPPGKVEKFEIRVISVQEATTS